MTGDAELLRAYVREGRGEALAELMGRHIGLVYGAALRQMGDVQEAEDVAQAVMVVLKEKGHTIREEMAVGGWLLSVTRCAAVNAMRKRAARRKHERAAGRAEGLVEEAAAWEEMAPVLDGALAKLGEKDRDAIVRRFFEGMAFDEMAAEMGVTEGAARRRVGRAVERLRGLLKKRGAGVAAGMVGAAVARGAVVAAPAEVAGRVTASVMAGAGGKAAVLAKGAWQMMRWAKMKVVVGMAGVMIVVGAVVLAMAARSKAAGESVAAATQGEVVDAGALVREVRGKEAWIGKVESFRVKAATVFTMGAESIAHRRAELKAQFPTLEPDVKRFPELSGRQEDTVELAFDKGRVMYHLHRPSALDHVGIWDGKKGWVHNEYYSHVQEGYVIQPTVAVVHGAMDDFSWPRADVYGRGLWWDVPDAKEAETLQVKAEEFRLAGREKVEGVDCYVLIANRANLERWYVGVEDHLLRRLDKGQLPGNPGMLRAIQEAGKKGGAEATDRAGIEKWMGGLAAAERKKVEGEVMEFLQATDKPLIQHRMGDYVEVAPGCWYPKRQGYVIYGYDVRRGGTGDPGDWEHPWEETRREITVTEVAVGEKLPAEMFVMAMKEGAEVYYQTQDPAVEYRYKREMTAEEWGKIVENAKQQREEMAAMKAAEDAMVGKAAPAFDAGGTWLNGEALDWGKLKGKVVVVDFFAEWCGPCRNDFPLAEGMFEGREKNGYVVIGVHVAGSKREDIERLLKDYKMAYPVYVDVAGSGMGKVVDAFGVKYLPQAVVVDGEGKVVAHGELVEMARKAREVAKGGRP